MTASSSSPANGQAISTALWFHLVLSALALGLLTDLLFNGVTGLGLNAPTWIAALIGASLLAARRARRRIDPHAAALLVISCVLATMIAWRAAEELQALLLLTSLGTLLLAFAIQDRLHRRRPSLTLLVGSLVVAALGAVRGLFMLAASIPLPASLDPEHRVQAGAVIRAVLIAAPLLLVFGALFVAADAVFEAWVRDALRIDLGALGRHLAWVIAGAVAAAGLLSSTLDPGFDIPKDPRLPEDRRLRALETGIVLGGLATLFALFVGIQLRYLFGGNDHVQATTGLTYAQYARRGFFELVAVAALLLPVLLAAEWAQRRAWHSLVTFRSLATLLVILLAVVMASALERLRIYVDAYGLTILRLYVAAFLLSLAVVFAILLWSFFRERRDHLVVGAVTTAVAALALLVAVNPHAIVAATNLDRARDGREFDTAHALLLSADATPTLVTGLDALPPADACQLATTLLDRWTTADDDLRSWNWDRATARSAVASNRDQLQSTCG